jgi:hypothetical protein
MEATIGVAVNERIARWRSAFPTLQAPVNHGYCRQAPQGSQVFKKIEDLRLAGAFVSMATWIHPSMP